MKKILKIVVVIIILVTLLSGNASVLAKASVDMLSESKTKINTIENETKIPENSVNEQTDEIQNNDNKNQTLTSEKSTEETEANENTEKIVEENKEKENKTSSNNEVVLFSNMEKNETKNGSVAKTNTQLGKLWIEINLRLPQIEQNLKVTIKKSDKFVKEFTAPTEEAPKTNLAGDENGEEYYTSLYYISDDLEPGNDYSIEITGKYYIAYTQNEIEIKENNETKIKLTNGHYSDNMLNGLGVIALGDVNLDNKIDELDIKEMVEQIESANPNSDYDLNGDGEVNIVDLSYIAINKNEGDLEASTTSKIKVDNNKVSKDMTKGSIVSDGNTTLNDILEDNGKAVTFAPNDPEKEISASNPIEITLDLGDEILTETGAITISPSTNRENNIISGVVTIETADSKIIEAEIPTKTVAKKYSKITSRAGSLRKKAEIATIASTPAEEVTIDPDGTIVINLGEKIAIKKVTIRVTGTESNKLADISKVEFLNDMTDRIPAPSVQSPTGVKGDATSEYLTISWNNMQNITGYEVYVECDGVVEHHSVDGHTIKIQRFNNKDIDELHYKEFTIKVQSVNGEWRSGYSEEIKLTPKPTSVPAAPDNLKLTGKFKEIEASWKKMKSTKTYNVYYREYENGSYIKVAEGLTSPSYTIVGLSDEIKQYQVYVTGVNDIGESKPSLVATVKTISVEPAKLPKYKMINTPNGEGELTKHIVNATYVSERGFMVGSPLDESSEIKHSALGTVDNSYSSFWQINDWDDGANHIDPNSRGILYEFDNEYEMNYFAVAQVESMGYIERATVTYWDDQNVRHTVTASQVLIKTDQNGREYTTIKITDKIKTNKVLIGIGRASSYTRKLTVAEMRFYYYDDLEEQIDNLYEGQMHVTLKKDVTETKIKELEDKLETPDEESGELHPEYDSLKAELETARQILTDANSLKPAIKIDTTVTSAKDVNVSFKDGINAWQPLGIVGYAGEQLTIYVGNKEKNVGNSTPLQLIATQYDAESAAWKSTISKNLVVGKNTITIPHIQSIDCEKGGSLYINYTGNNSNEVYAVRVVGGQEIPVLDLTKKDLDRETKIKNYVVELEEVVPNLEKKHNEIHAKEQYNGILNYSYNKETCILGATEIVLDEMMYSVSSEQILAGLGTGSIDEKAKKLSESLQAMDEMMDLFYSHKGMSKDITVGEKNSYPSGRQNIRYHRMFAGAAMYAGGLHIGIPWGDIQTLSKGNLIVSDENGKYISGNYFGWGIAHEIGHIINDGNYAQAEVTNNYFSVLSQAKDTNSSVRFEYPKVYEKVTSGKIGKADNVFTQLGLYWQLHLAYDNDGYNYKKYTSHDEQTKNLIFARIDTYSRDPSKAPNEGIELKLDSDADNNLIRLACAATKKNLLAFFERWGYVPNQETIKYANQWVEETKAIYYINDEARVYQLEKNPAMKENTKVVASAKYEVNYDTDETKNEVKLTLGNTNQLENKDAILGYEIVRSYWDNNKEIQRPVAFVTANGTENIIEYTDRIETINNRVITYKIIAYDKYLNATEQLVLDPIKVKLDGSIVKDNWELESNLEEDTEFKQGDDKTTCEPEKETEISKIANKNYEDDFQAKLPIDKDAEIVISLDEVKSLVGLKYTAGLGTPIKNYEIKLSTDKENWITVKTGEFKLTDKQETVYFNKENDDRLYTYQASYVKLVIKNQSELSIAELDLLGESGDNIELLENGIGILKEQYLLGKSDATGNDEYIPTNSIVFTGTYKGNPAYNVIKLWNQDNKLINGQQVIFADNPKNGELGEVSKGIWIYWIEPSDDNYDEIKDSLETVRAELYRVDNAQTNEGERLVSDTYRVKIDKPIKNIEITSNKAN